MARAVYKYTPPQQRVDPSQGSPTPLAGPGGRSFLFETGVNVEICQLAGDGSELIMIP